MTLERIPVSSSVIGNLVDGSGDTLADGDGSRLNILVPYTLALACKARQRKLFLKAKTR